MVQYALAALLVVVALLARQIALLRFGIDLPAFITFYPAIMLVALLFGLWAGLLSTALASLLAAIWVFPLIGQIGVTRLSDVIALLLFFSMGVFMSLVADRYRRDQRRLAAVRQQLALRETRAKLEEQSAYRRLALEAAELGAWDYNLDTGEVIWDESCRNGFGFSTGESISYQTAIDRIHPEDRLDVDHAVNRAIAGDEDGAYHREFRVVWPDGSEHWIASHGRVYFDRSGEEQRATRFIGVNADITARKQAESTLQTTLQRFYAILSNLYSGVLLVTNEGQVEFANQSLCDLFGIADSPASLVGLPSGDMLGKVKSAYRDPGQAVARILEIVAAGQPVSGEELAMRDGGTCLRDCVPLRVDGKSFGRLWVHTDITERKRMEDDLRQAQRQWERTFDSVPDLIAILDNQHRIVRVNRAMAQRLGSSPEACAGQECFGCVHAASGPIPSCPHVLTLRDGREHTAEVHEERLGGDFLVTTTPLLDENGKMDGAVHVARDITEQKRAKEALHRSEEQFRTLANAIPQLSWMANADGGLFWYNDRWYDYTGTTAEQMEGWGWQSVHDPEVLPRVLERWRNSIATGDPFDMVFPLRGADGVFRPFLTRVMPLKDAEGKVVRWFGTNTDVTERQRAQDALQKANQRLQTVLDSITDGLLVMDREWRFTFCSEHGARILGVHSGDLVGASMRDAFPRVVDTGFADAFQRAMNNRKPVHFEDFYPEPLNMWLECHCYPGEDGLSVYFRDISERKRTEEALLRSEKLASVGRVAATIAHEINNPLAAITNTLYLANLKAGDPASVREFLGMAEDELKRITHITRQTLGFYRESSGPAIVSVNAVLESAIDLMKSKIVARRAVIEKDWSGDTMASIIAGGLRQVFSNLLGNSLDALDEEGAIKLRVAPCTDLRSGVRAVRITIADNGKGIANSAKPHLFEPFFTTKGTVGTGLGLWVTRQIVDKHHGKILMRSATQGARRGTTFMLILPVEPSGKTGGKS